jgi:prolyl oligopeptidase PreP (S9A serine peptidase family)
MKKKQERKRNHATPMQQANAMTDFSSDQTDPQGSYTGCPADPYEKPVQDADDL